MIIDERSVTTALKAYARGIDVTDADLDRLEGRVHDQLHGAADRGRTRRPWEWAVAACAVVALVLAMTALWRTRTQDAVPATLPPTTITSADLAGTWLVDVKGDNWLWHFTADGHLSFTSGAKDYIDLPEQTTFTLEGVVLNLGDGGQDECRTTVRLSGEGRMSLTPVADAPPCSMFDAVNSWPFIRVSPASDTSAMLPSRHDELRRLTRDLQFMEDVAGTWLLKGTGTILAVVRTSTGAGDYVIDDDGDGLVDQDQRGTFVLGADGGAVLRPEGGAEQGCDTVYSRVTTTGDTFTVELSDSSCGRLGAEGGTWIRLN